MTAGARAGALGDTRDANATTNTLNYALGTRHMKSWMTGAVNSTPPTPSILTPTSTPPVKRKRGRPRKYPLPDAVVQHQHVTDTAPFEGRPTAAPSAERLPPSNSTSPQLANIVTNHPQGRRHGVLDVTVFPSPTPSEEDAHTAGLQRQEIGIRQSVNIDRLDFASVQSPTTSSSNPPIAARSPTRQDFPPPTRPAGEYPTHVGKRARLDAAPFPATIPTAVPPPDGPTFPEFPPRTSAPQPQHMSPLLGPAASRSPSLGQVTNGHRMPIQLMQTTQPPGRSISSRGNPSLVQDHLVRNAPARQTHASPQLDAQPLVALPSTQQFATAVSSHRRATSSDGWYTIDTCVGLIRSFDAEYPAMYRNRKDELRLQVLQEAVRGHDWAYLTLHQYYCIMAIPPQSLNLTLQRNDSVSTAYLLMREVLDDNSQLSPAVLAFFSTFPFAVDYLARTWPARYQYAEREFKAFVVQSPNVGGLRQASERRGFPPTPREFASCAIKSPTFQRLLLRSIVRGLWANYPHVSEKGRFEIQAVDAFSNAQALFEQRRVTDGLGGPEQADVELRDWRIDFLRITSLFETFLQRQGFQPINAASPRLGQSQQPQQPQPQPRHQQPQPRAHPQQRTHVATGSADFAMPRRQRPPPTTTQSRTASQASSSSRPRQTSTALLPRPGLIQPQQRVPIPSRFGLHQAHLRSPVLHAADLPSPCFYFWQGFVRKPQRLENANSAIEKLSFTLSAREMTMLASPKPTVPGHADARLVDENKKIIRLRCVKWPSKSAPKDEAWAVADNSWVPHAYFSLNGVPLQLRKKLHYGKDLPVDLTGLVKEAENILEISVMSNSDDTNHRNYLVAVEFLGIMTKANITRRCKDHIVSSDVVLNDIRRKLAPIAADDDDIVLVESTLTINLRDPFSASKICDVPVRGTACRHNECFDLDTFLETRPRKGDVTTADQWRCPICKADARPTALIVDGFLVEVRGELERKGLLDIRAIIVNQDGSWKPKIEERDPNGVSDRDTPDPMAATVPTALQSKQSVAHDIIDLDSD